MHPLRWGAGIKSLEHLCPIHPYIDDAIQIVHVQTDCNYSEKNTSFHVLCMPPLYLVLNKPSAAYSFCDYFAEPCNSILVVLIWSAFREASFGHGELEFVNSSHALWSWHRNDDDEPMRSEHVWISSLGS
ncbi:hypothetical protein MLD38_035268 [Melastoma candidum]|uniref:Uncharacterized protein n=1 Tax=Melastoma candidum TaxID=119954 RepID=A0ACB9MFQ5_9MYRT|nr:hypothetical protein MLD38_035268 [Melastoma candidum]